MRTILVHYHLFKNAGSTMDGILQNNFGTHWVAFEGATAASKLKPHELAEFIKSNPSVQAISSHHLSFPVPKLENVEIIPILFFRHPIDRVRSIYDFERKQGLTNGPVSKGAEHAAKLSFVDYLRWRLDSSVNGVVHNCQTAFLLGIQKFNRKVITQANYEQALLMLESLPFCGVVEDFDAGLVSLGSLLRSKGVDLKIKYVKANVNLTRAESLEQRLENLRNNLGADAWGELYERNNWDLKLYAALCNDLNRGALRASWCQVR